MSLRRSRYVLAPVLAAALAAPAGATASAQRHGGAQAPEPAPRGGVASMTHGPVSVSVKADALLNRTTRFRGTAPADHAGRTVTIERLDAVSGQWLFAAAATIGADGTFVARWKADRVGVHRMRSRIEGADARAATATADAPVTVYRRDVATWYGPGFYGNRTACGQRMTRALLGVAHRRLRCGTPVALLYRGRVLTVPVVDRGPFRKGTTWDLTAATAGALGMTATSRIGALRLPRSAAARRAG